MGPDPTRGGAPGWVVQPLRGKKRPARTASKPLDAVSSPLRDPPTLTLPHKGEGTRFLPPPLWGRAGVGGGDFRVGRGFLAPPDPSPYLPHKGGGDQNSPLPPCGGGPGWGVVTAQTWPRSESGRRADEPPATLTGGRVQLVSRCPSPWALPPPSSPARPRGRPPAPDLLRRRRAPARADGPRLGHRRRRREPVRVTVQGRRPTSVGQAAAWRSTSPLEAGGPFETTIAGKDEITIKNILIGEVWVCSGQSNMDLTVPTATAPIARSPARRTRESGSARCPGGRPTCGSRSSPWPAASAARAPSAASPAWGTSSAATSRRLEVPLA